MDIYVHKHSLKYLSEKGKKKIFYSHKYINYFYNID